MVLKLSNILLVCLVAYASAASKKQQLLAVDPKTHPQLPATYNLDPLTLTGYVESNPKQPLLFYPSLPLTEFQAEARQADFLVLLQQLLDMMIEGAMLPPTNFTYFEQNGGGSTMNFDINHRRYYSINGSPQFLENYLKSSGSAHYPWQTYESVRARRSQNPATGAGEEILKGVPLPTSEGKPSDLPVQSGIKDDYEPNIDQKPGVLAKEFADFLVEQKQTANR